MRLPPDDHTPAPDPLPLFANPHNGTETSIAAADRILDTAGTLEQRVYDHLKTHGPKTREELELELGMPGSTLRPRVWGLSRAGKVRENGWERLTRSGRRAKVLEAV